MIDSLKNLLSKIVIATKKNKSMVYIKVYKKNLLLLDFLWEGGFIFGYTNKFNNEYVIYIKKVGINDLFKNILFSKSFLCLPKNKFLLKIEKNTIYFIKTPRGIFFQKHCLQKCIGGFIIAKI